MCLASQSITQSADADWNTSNEGKKASTKGNIELGVEYRFPGNEDVRVTFTCLPKDPSKRSPLSIEQIKTSDIDLPSGVVAAGEYAYDITTDMENGSFKYDLELPKIASGKFDISYIEKSAEEVVSENLSKSDVKKVEDKKVDNKHESVEATELDHFTVFVVTTTGGPVTFEITTNECVNDSAGANDLSGQKDLTKMCQDTTSSSGTLNITWDWDDIEWNGANTGDACSLYDTDGDGRANYSLCVVVGGDPAVYQSTRLYACNDSRADRCGGSSIINSFASACTASVLNNEDPFPTGNDYPKDTVARCVVSLADMGGASNAQLIDVCSYPSQQPNSDPSDCIVYKANSGKLEVKKSLSPTTDSGQFNLQIDGVTQASNVVHGGTTGEKVVTVATHTFNEAAGTGTNLVNYTKTAECRSLNGTGATVPVTGTGPWTVSVTNESDIVCTITNTRVNNATLTIIKDALPNDAQDFSFTTTGTGLSNFSLDDDSDGTLSNTRVFSNLGAGTYSVTEGAVAGWTQTSATCSDGSLISAINLSAGENVTCTFTNTKAATLTLVKNVTNDNGGSAVANDFQGKIDGSNVAWGVPTVVTIGGHTASEVNLPGYAAGTWGGDCASNGAVSLAAGENKTCTITNDDIAPRLNVIKHVINDNGGAKVAGDFTMNVTGTNVSSTSFAGSETGTQVTLNAGSYSVDEMNLSGYTKTLGANCSGTIAIGETKTCTITNDDQAATLIVKKVLPNDNGGTATASQFSFSVNTGAATAFEADGENQMTVPAGTYSVVETNPMTGYAVSYDNCTNVVIPNGGTATCTITNDDIAPKLTVTKVVINDDGGSLQVSQVPLFVDTTSVVTGVQNTFNAGAHVVSETQQTGYSATISGDCAANGAVVLAPGDVKSCTITNDDIQPKLTVIKLVTNNNGGNLTPADFIMQVMSVDTSYQFEGTSSGHTVDVNAGSYSVNEVLIDGYVPQYSADCAGTILPGETKVCTITNDDQAPTLTLVKTVVNDNGGTKVVADFPLSVNGIPVTSGQAVTLEANTLYTASEINAPGYTAGVWGADCAANGTITLKPGEHKTCTITNDDQAGTLIVKKVVVNDNGGNNKAEDFSFVVNSGSSVSFEADGQNEFTVNAGVYSVIENGAPGYTTSYDNCSVTIPNGGTATCTITNDDIAPTVTLNKVVINDNGGSAGSNEFGLSIGGTGVTSGQTLAVAANTPVALNEAGLAGYHFVSLTGDNKCPRVLNGTVTLDEGENITCTITNDDEQAYIIVDKTVVNDNGGTQVANDFQLTVDGNAVLDEVAYAVNPGAHTAGETSIFGYVAGAWGSDCALDGGVTVALGETKTCTITNDDIAPRLTVTKIVVNDGFGDKRVIDFPLFVNKTSVTSGVENSFSAGSYTVSETNQAGYSATIGGDCLTDGSVSLAVGQVKACTITNDDTFGRIIIEKQVVGSNRTFTFDPSYGDNFSLGDDQQNISQALLPGEYSISETVPTGWMQTSVVCSDGSSPDEINLSDGETVTCVFTNTQLGNVRIVKDALPDSSQDFTFTDDFGLGQAVSFTLDDDDDDTLANGQTFDVLPGTYKVTEEVLDGWKQAGATCTDGSSVETISVDPGENITCTFTNKKLGSITLVKNTAGGDNTFSFTMTGEGLPASTNLTTVLGTASQTFSNLDPDNTYSISETVPVGWDLVNTTCIDETQAEVNPTAMDLNNGGNITCTFANEKRGEVVVTKIDDVNGNGRIDEGDNGLSDWEMNLGEVRQTTGEDGSTTFTNLVKGEYTLGETGQNGWEQTGIYCDGNEEVVLDKLQSEEVVIDTTTSFYLNPGETKRCYVLNHFIDPTLTIEKSNDSFPVVETPGNTVTYTLKVTADDNTVEGVTLTDLPPAGFVYVPGSATATSSLGGAHDGALELSHEYASPGVWSLGNMVAGEEVTLTYQARISGSQDEGLYNDLAYATGSSLRGADVLATDVSDADNFAATRVAVAIPTSDKVKIDTDKETEVDTKKKYVLGAALPATGANGWLLVLALALLIVGAGVLLSDRKKKSMKAWIIMLVMAGGVLTASGVQAATVSGLAVSMEEPDSAVNNPDFKIGFVALDILKRDVTVECYANGALYDTHTLIPGGSSGDCQVSSAALPATGTYDFYVTATVGGEGGGTLESNHETVKYVSGGPGTPREYERDEATCDDKISFRTDSDGGRTVKVEVYRSKNKTFVADATTLVETLAIGSDTEGTITTTPPSCQEDYWYAIRAVDENGFGSDFVGDKDINVTTDTKTKTITRPGAGAAGGALSATESTVTNPEGTVEGAAVENNQEAGSPEVLGEMTEDDTDTGSWAANNKGGIFVGVLILLGALYYLYAKRRTRQTSFTDNE